MVNKQELRPTKRLRVIDLVQKSGLDVSDWGKFKGGPLRASTNPRYCYNWSFVDQNRAVVLNLWFENLLEEEGRILQRHNLRILASKLQKPQHKKRARDVDAAILLAFKARLPLRAIICGGKMRNVEKDPSSSSKVDLRMLDPEVWTVESYDDATGDCVLVRGRHPVRYADQFSISPIGHDVPNKRLDRHGLVFARSYSVRMQVLERSKGRCELGCDGGFNLPDGRRYLETHHVIPLSDNGRDDVYNVVALCPNHHREAHFGCNADALRVRLLEICRQNCGAS